MNELTEILVSDVRGLFIPFQWKDTSPGGSNLGRAEFDVCQIYKRRKLVEYFVYPRQQRNVNHYWRCSYGSEYGLSVNSYEGLETPNIWRFFYCKEHKTIGMSIYVPTDAKFLYLKFDGIGFTRTNWHAE